jgi:hypothetical protein
MNDSTLHLTEDQLDDHLIGDLAAPAAAHLAACQLCSARVAAVASPIASFQSVSLAWSERVSAAAPMPELPSSRTLLERRLAWSFAVAACAVGLGLTGLRLPGNDHRIAAPAPAATAAIATHAATPTAAQLSSDNQLLRNIDRELDASAETPDLGLVPVRATARTRSNPAYQD